MRLYHRSCGLMAFRLATQHPTQLSSARESEDHTEVPVRSEFNPTASPTDGRRLCVCAYSARLLLWHHTLLLENLRALLGNVGAFFGYPRHAFGVPGVECTGVFTHRVQEHGCLNARM